MRLITPERPEHFELIADWLGREENHQWLDFGQGVQVLTAASLRIMTQRKIQFIRIYAAEEDDDLPIGVVALSNVDTRFKTATTWFVLGEKGHGGRATARAVSRLLTLGFEELGLEAVNAWTVETNAPAQRLMERLRFRYIGRQRRCHYLNGRPLDRLWYDLLKSEHQEI